MNKFYWLLTLFCLTTNISVTQNLTALVVDKQSGNPIPYAAIKIDDFKGVITNDEGLFTVRIDDIKYIEISCLGYKELKVTVEDIRANNYKIELETAVNQLNEVIVSNKLPAIDSIIVRVRNNFYNNHNLNLTALDVFSRQTNYFDFEDFEFDVKKASTLPKNELRELKQNADSLNKAVMKSSSKNFEDFSGKLYIFEKDSTKLTVDKLTNLVDRKNDYSVDIIQDKAQIIFLKALDSNVTYKVRTGIFRIEDSLDIEMNDLKEEYANTTNNSALKAQLEYNMLDIRYLENHLLDDILNTKYYDFTMRDIVYTDGEMAYIIDFKPRKGKSKFAGTLIVMANSYAIKRIDYAFAPGKRGTKVNLKLIAGIKYVEESETGTIHFSKDANNTYKPFYIQKGSINYVYVNRPFTFVENSKEKNKFGFNLSIEGRVVQKSELLITGQSPITPDEFAAITEAKKVNIITLEKYTPSIWEDRQILEPVEEMKSFTVKN
jgi:hypothetical protein